ncbi:glycosyltransferase [Nafulsella turpanensis]|uniref:glycosyltransferase n=1 Tax=Nafulsella turpanensis TaxID=1265690 RepID=UPI000349DD9C|nr:glycosyltransferase [Nafulsella turpanensis]
MRLSVIIPTFNEGATIRKTLQTLLERADQPLYEIIVIDSGSTDGTLKEIEHEEVVTIVNPRMAGKKCRALRMATNIAQGDVLFFLDADTIVPEHYDSEIKNSLKDPKVVGGAFEFSFDRFSIPLYLITLVNRIRYRYRKRFYGDQGIFVRRDAYLKAGGWPERNLLEAAYLCRNLQKYGKLKLIRKSTLTSSRRFTDGGVWKVFAHDIYIWGRDLLGLDVEKYAASYWAKNKAYGRKELEKNEQVKELQYD